MIGPGASRLIGQVLDDLIERHSETYAVFTYILGSYTIRGRLTEAFYADPAGIKQVALRQAGDQLLLTLAPSASSGRPV